MNRWCSFTAAPGANDEVNENLQGFSTLVADVQGGTQTLGGNWVIVWIEDDDEVSGLVDAETGGGGGGGSAAAVR